MDIKNIVFSLERVLDRALGAYNHAPQPSNDPLLKSLGSKYGLRITAEDSLNCADISYQQLDGRRKKIFADLLVSELSVYPAEIIRQSRVEQIVLCSKLRSFGTDIAGLAQMGFLVVDTLYLDADRIAQNWEYARKAFHHELYHAIDFHDDLFHYIDPTWSSLNPPGFSYSHNKEKFAGYNQPSNSLGFLSTYARTAIPEDKAELYCHLMVNHAEVINRSKRDLILSSKVQYMKDILRAFCTEFDEPFWQRIDTRSRTLRASKHSEWQRALKLRGD